LASSASPDLSAPLVSVVTPVWNAEATLAETVASVRAQSLADWELLLVDDASGDGSRDLARALAAADPRIRLIERATNGGAAAARNDAIRAARGRLIAFLDADDRWYPDKLARQTGFMAAGGHGLVFSGYRRVATDGTPLGVVRPPARVSRDQLLRGNVIGCLTAVYDTEVFGKVEMPPLRRRQDYGLWLTLLKSVPYAHSLPEALADYRVRPGSLSGGKLGAARDTWTLYREVEGLGRARAGWYLAHNLARALAKRAG
jgi:teichuronic acid biosynthesis glycosyltransferase TuaG